MNSNQAETTCLFGRLAKRSSQLIREVLPN